MLKFTRSIPQFRIHNDYYRFKAQQAEKQNLNRFKQTIHKAATLQKIVNENTAQAQLLQEQAFFTSATPLRTILAVYLQKRGYSNEDLIGQTLIHLSEALLARGEQSYYDHSDYVDTAGFNILMKDLKVIENHKVFAQVLKGLTTLNYDIEDQIIDRAFQLLQQDQENILQHPKLKSLLQDLFLETQQNEKSKSVLSEIEDVIIQTQQDVFTVIDSIVQIRNLYQRLVPLCQSEWIHVNTNIKMLEFEEALITSGLLLPSEIKSQNTTQLDLYVAMEYITGNNLDLVKFICTLLKIKFAKTLGKIPVSPIYDFGDLIEAISLAKGEKIADRLLESKQYFINSNRKKLAYAYANAKLFQQAKEYNIQEDSLENLQFKLKIGDISDKQMTINENYSIYSLDQLIDIITYQALQQQQNEGKQGELLNELKDRIAYLNSIYDLTTQQQERIQSIEQHYKIKLCNLEYNIEKTELYTAIKNTLPQNIQLIESQDVSLANELNGYAQLKVGNDNYLTIRDFYGKNKEEFKSKLLEAFNYSQKDVTIFNNINTAIENIQVEENSILDFQLLLLKQKALKHLQKYDDLNKLLLKQTLLDIQERVKLSQPNFTIQSLIDSLKTVQIHFPKWYGLQPSQVIYDAKESIDGFKASLISTNYQSNETEYDLIQTLQTNGLIDQTFAFPNHQKLRNHYGKHNSSQIIGNQSNEVQQLLQKQPLQYDPDKSDYFAINLLNFKAELQTKPLNEIVDIVFQFGIWDKLIKERITGTNQIKPNGIFLSRDAEILQQALLQQNKEPTSVEYLRKKLNENTALNDMIKIRSELFAKLNQDIKNNVVTKQTVNKLTEKINSMISEKIDEIKGEFRRKHSSPYYKQKTNYIEILYNEEHIKRLELEQTNDQFLDVDLLQGLDKLVTLKRSRAEEKLATYYLLNQQLIGQKPNMDFLNTLQIYNPKIQITQLQIKDLKLPKMIHSNLSNFGEYSASDLLLIISTLFDDQLFRDIMSKKFYQQHQLQYHIRRRDSQLLLQQQEKQIWLDSQRLTDKELKDINEMLEFGKVNNQGVELLNKTDYPLQNIYQWVFAKSTEKINISIIDQNDENLWLSVFKQDYNSTTSEQLHQIVELLLERFYLLQQHPIQQLRPLLRMILSHKELSQMDRQNLQCYRLQFNSQDVLDIQQAQQKHNIPQYLWDASYSYGEKFVL